jgi:hypothetical protein
MKITKLNASFSCKKQIAQYEPIDIFMAVEAEVSEADDIPATQAKLFSIAKAGVDAQLTRLTGGTSTPTLDDSIA